MKPPPSQRTPVLPASRLTLILGAVVLIAAAVPFAPALSAGFVDFDDTDIIVTPTGYRGFSPENIRWMFTTTHMGHYQPLTWLSYAFDYSIRGLDPAGFHGTNILIHACNALLVYLLARRLFAAGFAGSGSMIPPRSLEVGAAAAALLFAIHPLRVESVAWVTERRDVLSTLFMLLTALAYLRAISPDSHAMGSPRSVTGLSLPWYAVSIALLLCSLLSKAWGLTFFAVAAIIDWYPLRRLPGDPRTWSRPPARGVLLQKAPYAFLGLVFAMIAGRAVASVPFTVISYEQWPLEARLLQACYGVMFYIQKLLNPTNLAALYELEPFKPLGQMKFLAGVAFTAALAAAAFALRRRAPAFTAAALAYVVVLSPVLGFRQAGPQLVADRYSYIANIAWALLLGAALVVVVRRCSRPALGALAAVCAVLGSSLAYLTWQQTRVWKDTITLFAHAINAGADGPIIRQNYATQLLKAGRTPEAIEQFQAATALEPRYGEPWFKLANALKDQNRLPEAEQAYIAAAKSMSDSWRPNLMLGIMYFTRMDRTKDAAERFRAAVSNAESTGNPPGSSRAYLMLAGALDELGDEQGCRQMLQKATTFPDVRDEAMQHLREMGAPP